LRAKEWAMHSLDGGKGRVNKEFIDHVDGNTFWILGRLVPKLRGGWI
jgi:hypothetical protein